MPRRAKAIHRANQRVAVRYMHTESSTKSRTRGRGGLARGHAHTKATRARPEGLFSRGRRIHGKETYTEHRTRGYTHRQKYLAETVLGV